MILHGLMEFLAVVGAPRMKSDEERDGYILGFWGKEDGGLFGTVDRTGDAYLANLTEKEGGGEKKCDPRNVGEPFRFHIHFVFDWTRMPR
tara:strand:- start:6852 stop:7121 length:270 start_codon:yes stop_codon:yes gene_type:complete